MAHHSPAKKFFQIEVLRHCIVDFVDPCTEASFSRVFCHQVRCWRWRETRPFSEQWNSFYLLSNHRKRYASFCRVLSDSWSCPDVQRVFKTHTWTCRGLYIEKTTFQVIFSPFLQRGQIPSIPAMQGDGKQFLLPMFGTERKDDKNNWDMCPNRYDASLSRLLAIRSLEDTGIHYNFLIKDLGYFSDHVRSEAPRKSQRELDLEECLWRHGDKSILESFVNKNKSRDEILQTETLPLEMRIFHGLPLEKLLDPIEKALERWCDNALREKILDHCLCTMPLTVFQATISWLMPDLWFDELKWLENFFSARSLRHPYENVILRFTSQTCEYVGSFSGKQVSCATITEPNFLAPGRFLSRQGTSSDEQGGNRAVASYAPQSSYHVLLSPRVYDETIGIRSRHYLWIGHKSGRDDAANYGRHFR